MKRPPIHAITALCMSLAAAMAPLPASANPDTANPAEALAALEGALAEVRTVRTAFVQEKRLALFKKPLLTRGSILLEMPDKMLWRVEEPIRYALLLDGRQARQWDGETGKTQRIPVDHNPVFAAVTEQLRAWFGGRYATLASDYDITRVDAATPSAFIFTPKADTPAAKMLLNVEVVFRDDQKYIASIRISEAGGDVTIIRFENTVINGPITAQEWSL